MLKYKQLIMNKKMVFFPFPKQWSPKAIFWDWGRTGKGRVCEGLVAGLEGTEQGRVRRASPEGSSGSLITSKDLMQQENTLIIWGARLLSVREEENQNYGNRKLEWSLGWELLAWTHFPYIQTDKEINVNASVCVHIQIFTCCVHWESLKAMIL